MSDFDVMAEKAGAARARRKGSGGEGAPVRGAALAGGPAHLPGGPAHVLALQRSVGNAAVVQTLAGDQEEAHPITQVVARGGSALQDGVRQKMETAFGQDFSDVRVHSDTAASDSAQSVAATAATVGNHIVFRSGQYDPASTSGQHLLAHELTHVVQQRQGAVDGTPAPGGIRVSDPSDRFERAAEANASRVTAQLSSLTDDAAGGAGGEPAVQRQAEEDEVEGEEG